MGTYKTYASRKNSTAHGLEASPGARRGVNRIRDKKKAAGIYCFGALECVLTRVLPRCTLEYIWQCTNIYGNISYVVCCVQLCMCFFSGAGGVESVRYNVCIGSQERIRGARATTRKPPVSPVTQSANENAGYLWSIKGALVLFVFFVSTPQFELCHQFPPSVKKQIYICIAQGLRPCTAYPLPAAKESQIELDRQPYRGNLGLVSMLQ